MTLKRSGFALFQKSVLAMPARPLGLADLRIVQQALNDMASDWSVELDGACLNEANLVLLPDGGDDAVGPSFVISRENFGFRLDQLHWDVMQEVGTFAELTDTIDAVRTWLAFSAGPSTAVSLTLH